MRKAVFLALAIGVALPVAAHAQNADDHHHHHDDANGGGDKHDKGHGDRADRGTPDRGPGPGPAQRGPVQADRGPAPVPNGRGSDGRGGDRRFDAAPGINRLDGHTPHSDGRGYPVPAPDAHGHGEPQAGTWDRDHQPPAGNWDRGRQPPPGGWDRDHQPSPSGWDRDHRPPPGGWDRDHRSAPDYGRPGYGGHDWRQGAPGGWNRNWRQDQRFDWQRYRAYNRDRFHAPRYYAPRGYDYGYRRWYPGIRIAPFYFAQQYLIGDPFFYHLPPPPPGCAWVRYYNDVALVDLGDGEVIDVIPDFFF